jgi:hypothetical protein
MKDDEDGVRASYVRMDHLKVAGIMRLKDSDGLAGTTTSASQGGFQTNGILDTYCRALR